MTDLVVGGGAVGTLVAWALLPGLSIWELALVAVILAPTDAALGQPAITDPVTPTISTPQKSSPSALRTASMTMKWNRKVP